MEKNNKNTKNKNNKKENISLSIEDSFKSIDSLISKMEDDKCTLEKNLDLYKQGVTLLNEIKNKIEKVETELTILEEEFDDDEF